MISIKDYYDPINLGGFAMKLIFVLILLSMTVNACSYLNHKFNLPNDNPVEQAIEGFIESETGLNIDLSPGD